MALLSLAAKEGKATGRVWGLLVGRKVLKTIWTSLLVGIIRKVCPSYGHGACNKFCTVGRFLVKFAGQGHRKAVMAE